VVKEAMNIDLLTNSLSAERGKYPSQRERFVDALTKAEAAHQAGTIANPVYIETKDQMNRAFDKAWDKIGEQFTHSGKYKDLPPAVHEFWYNFSAPQVHTVLGYLKRAEKGPNHPLVHAMVALFREMAPIAKLFADLKTMVTKRQPRAEGDPRFAAPPVVGDAAKRVHAMLTGLMTESFDGLVQSFVTQMNNQLDGFKTWLQAAKDEGKSSNPRRYAQERRGVDLNFLSRVTHDQRPLSMATVIDDDADAKILSIATRNATEIRELFVAKNLRKIVSIMDAKEQAGVALTELKVVSRHISLGGLTGEFHTAFADGSSFDFTNAVVWVINNYGTQFNRFPLTFHQVVMPNGKKMPRPSEERMNTVFIKGIENGQKIIPNKSV